MITAAVARSPQHRWIKPWQSLGESSKYKNILQSGKGKLLKAQSKMLAFCFVLLMNFMFQIFNHKETEDEAFDTESGFKEITFYLLC